jgi:EAL domain-containing protein (putative c-di-GMP-specific phosphodiesterase class I)
MGHSSATKECFTPSVEQLADALRTGELVPDYQPLWDIQRQYWEGVETLIRRQHPTKGLIGPDSFIPLAEQSGLILALGHFVLQEACHRMQYWHTKGLPHGVIAVNVSAL